jgi:hypothetical protein
VNDIIQDLISAYGSLERPSWHFAAQRLQRLPYADVTNLLSRYYVLEETTDLNDDYNIPPYTSKFATFSAFC